MTEGTWNTEITRHIITRYYVIQTKTKQERGTRGVCYPPYKIQMTVLMGLLKEMCGAESSTRFTYKSLKSPNAGLFHFK